MYKLAFILWMISGVLCIVLAGVMYKSYKDYKRNSDMIDEEELPDEYYTDINDELDEDLDNTL